MNQLQQSLKLLGYDQCTETPRKWTLLLAISWFAKTTGNKELYYACKNEMPVLWPERPCTLNPYTVEDAALFLYLMFIEKIGFSDANDAVIESAGRCVVEQDYVPFILTRYSVENLSSKKYTELLNEIAAVAKTRATMWQMDKEFRLNSNASATKFQEMMKEIVSRCS